MKPVSETGAEDPMSNNHVSDYNSNDRSGGWRSSRCMKFIRRNLLLLLTVVGILLGIAIGFIIRPFKPSKDALLWIGMPGEIFMRLLKMMILPLIICSVISGTASLNPKSNGKMGAIVIVYCMLTNFIGCILGLVYTLIIRPGRFAVDDNSEKVKTQFLQTQDIFADLLRNLVPDNIVEACFRQDHTKYREERLSQPQNSTGNGSHVSVVELYTYTKYLGKTDGANILESRRLTSGEERIGCYSLLESDRWPVNTLVLVFFSLEKGLVLVCVLIGIAVNKSKERGKPFLMFFTSATEVVLFLLRWLLWYTPIGVFSLIAVSLAGIDDLGKTFTQLGLLVLTVTVGVVTHQLVIMPLVIYFLTGRNPFRFILSISSAWMLTFASTSSAVAIPEMLQACEGPNINIDKRVSRFVVPFSVTINADGSAIYITIAALFVATVTGNPPGVSTMIIVVILTSIAAMAIPAVPSASIVTLVVILASIHVPANEIGFLFAVEWFLDRIRSTSNALSHTTCAAVVYRFCKADLETMPDTKKVDTEMEELIDDRRENPAHVESVDV